VKTSACCLVILLALPVTAAGEERTPDLVVGHDWGSSWVGDASQPAPYVELRVFSDGVLELVVGPAHKKFTTRVSPKVAEKLVRDVADTNMLARMKQLTTTFAPSCRTCEAMFVRIGKDKFRFASYLQIRQGGRVAALNTWEEAEPQIVALVKGVHALAEKSFANDYNAGFVFLLMHSQELMGACGVTP
jgi:hypothetical protein